jgi:Fic family protein
MSAAPIHHKWQEIADLPADLAQFRDPELESLYQVWIDQKDTVDEKAFAAELAREWSIETGIIEGIYTLDRGTTEVLIRRGIDSSYISRASTNQDPELVASTISAHEDVLEALFDFVAQRRELSTGYIKELHAALLLHQDTVKGVDQFGGEVYGKLKKGAYKDHPNNPTRRDKTVHEYCPPEHVASEMDRLIELHRQHEQRSMPAIVEAAWLHHAFTQIHPFQDGNGRVARALASLVLIKGGLFPLVVNRDDREKYIDTLEAADEGDLGSLVNLFARLQKRDLTKAIVYAAGTKPVSTLDDAIMVTKDVVVALQNLPAGAQVQIEKRATDLLRIARARLKETALKLAHELRAPAFKFGAHFSSLDGPSAALILEASGGISRIVVDFGTGAVGGPTRVGTKIEILSDRSVRLYDDAFRIDYLEPMDQLQPRFQKWLDDGIIRGLAEWRKTLV